MSCKGNFVWTLDQLAIQLSNESMKKDFYNLEKDWNNWWSDTLRRLFFYPNVQIKPQHLVVVKGLHVFVSIYSMLTATLKLCDGEQELKSYSFAVGFVSSIYLFCILLYVPTNIFTYLLLKT